MIKETKNETALKDFICGGAAAMINICLIYPFHKTIFFQQLDNLTWTQAAVRLLKEGPNKAYRGLLPILIQAATTRSIMFGGYGKSKIILDKSDIIMHSSMKVSISAIYSGVLESILMPFERIQVLLQNKQYNDKFKDAFHTFNILITDHGPKELYRGFKVVLYRNSIGNMIYFNVYEMFVLKSELTENISVSHHFNNFIIGGCLGACISLVIYPLNVVKTRQQSSIGGTFTSGTTILHRIYQERGRSCIQIYRGAPANCIRSVVSWGTITMANQFLRNLLSNI